MKPRHRLVLELGIDAGLSARMELECAGLYTVVRLASWAALGQAARDVPRPVLALVDPYYMLAPGGPPSAELRALLLECAWLPVVAVLGFEGAHMAGARILGEWGVCGLLAPDSEAAAIGEVLRAVDGEQVATFVARTLARSGDARQLIRAAADVGGHGGQAADLARLLHVSPRTLTRHFTQAQLGTPRQLLIWMRVLNAARLLDDPRNSMGDAAFACGYASDTGLRRALQDTLGASSGSLRQSGAFVTAAAHFCLAYVQPS
ncbi:MAG TPA: helix-turn-helix transcriptional regulator [Longimicrobium sp.]